MDSLNVIKTYSYIQLIYNFSFNQIIMSMGFIYGKQLF